MLDTSDAVALISQMWDACAEKAELHEGCAPDFFDRTGAMPTSPDERRRRPRFFCRSKAVLKAGIEKELVLGVYCRDISQEGVGLFAPRQLLPMEHARLYISPKTTLTVRVRNCKRLGDNCYVLGCDFDTDGESGPSLW